MALGWWAATSVCMGIVLSAQEAMRPAALAALLEVKADVLTEAPVSVVRSALLSNDPQSRATALRVLIQRGRGRPDMTVEERLRLWRQDRPAVQSLRGHVNDMLDDPDPAVRRLLPDTFLALDYDLESDRNQPSLGTSVGLAIFFRRESDPEIRLKILESLARGRSNHAAVLRVIESATADRFTAIRLAAIPLLVRLTDQARMARLYLLLKDSESNVRLAAAKHLNEDGIALVIDKSEIDAALAVETNGNIRAELQVILKRLK